jgi:hypothetical protein
MPDETPLSASEVEHWIRRHLSYEETSVNKLPASVLRPFLRVSSPGVVKRRASVAMRAAREAELRVVRVPDPGETALSDAEILHGVRIGLFRPSDWMPLIDVRASQEIAMRQSPSLSVRAGRHG